MRITKSLVFLIVFSFSFFAKNVNAQIPQLQLPGNVQLASKYWDVRPEGFNYWICDSLSPGQLFGPLKPHTGLTTYDSMHIVQTWIDSFIFLDHVKYQQYHKGLRLSGAVFSEHSYNGHVLLTIGNLCEDFDLPSEPIISEASALTTALTNVDAELYAWQDDSVEYYLRQDSIPGLTTYYPTGVLEYAHIGDSFVSSHYKLCWKFRIEALEPELNINVIVDAITGSYIGQSSNSVDNTGTFTHPMYGTRNIDVRHRDPGWPFDEYHMLKGDQHQIRTKDANFKLSWAEQDLPREYDNEIEWGSSHHGATSSHWAITTSWDLWRDVYHRKGFNDNNKNIRVWADQGYDNASFVDKGNLFDYDIIKIGHGDVSGSPLMAVLDIAGHEFTHGVNNSSAGLRPSTDNGESVESGAINEGYADIFGFMTERHFWGFQNWTIGDEVAQSHTFLRNMQNPLAATHDGCTSVSSDYPHSFNGANFMTSGTPNCTNHINCTVMDKCFYLLASGDTHNNILVTGVGIDKAALIAEFALTNFAKPEHGFSASREDWRAAARLLFGACSTEEKQTCRAWAAVQVGGLCNCSSPPSNDPRIICCPAPIDFDVEPPSPLLGQSSFKNTINKISVYPNPANMKLFINLGELSSMEKQVIQRIELIDVTGKVLKSNLYENIDIIELSILDVPQGIYLLKIQSTNNVFSTRVSIY